LRIGYGEQVNKRSLTMKINSAADLDTALESGPYAWPGGYPLFFIAHDGEALSFATVEENREIIADAIAEGDRSDWHVIEMVVNWEDANLYCAHSNERIESAYAEDEEDEA
jgi:hypothetical protein